MSNSYIPQVILQGPIEQDKLKLAYADSDFAWPRVQKKSAAIWKEKCSQAKVNGVELWDGTVYRISRINKLTNSGTGPELVLSTVKYSYITSFIQTVQEFGIDKVPTEYYINYIHTPIVIETLDSKMVLGQKKSHTNAKKYAMIGGFWEQGKKPVESAREIVLNAYKEAKEELGLECTHVKDSILLGIIRGSNTNIGITYYWRLNITFNELKALFKYRLDDELQEVVAFGKKEFEQILLGMGSSRLAVLDLVKTYWSTQ